MAPMSDYVRASLAMAIFPLSAYLVQSSHQSLWGILLLSNPFTIFLLISTLAQFSDPIQGDSNLLIDLQDVHPNPSYTPLNDGQDVKTNHPATRRSERPACCSERGDLIYWLHKYYIYSFHITLLFITRENLLGGLQLSRAELVMLYGSLIILVSLILNLRARIRWRTFDSGHIPSDTNEGDDVGSILIPSSSERFETNYSSCEQICYIKLLAHPTKVMRHLVMAPDNWLRLNNGQNENEKPLPDVLHDTHDATLPIPYEHMDRLQYNGQKVDDLHMIKRAARLRTQALVGRLSSASWFQRVIIARVNSLAESGTYLFICHLVHLFVLAQYAYLNLTFSCASKPSSTFGVKLLIPYDCSAVYEADSTKQRISMFAGIASSQLALCQLVMLALNVKCSG